MESNVLQAQLCPSRKWEISWVYGILAGLPTLSTEFTNDPLVLADTGMINNFKYLAIYSYPLYTYLIFVFQNQGNHMILPMTYTVAEAYIKSSFSVHKSRDTELLCTLRGKLLDLSTQKMKENKFRIYSSGSRADPTRLQVKQWVQVNIMFTLFHLLLS